MGKGSGSGGSNTGHPEGYYVKGGQSLSVAIPKRLPKEALDPNAHGFSPRAGHHFRPKGLANVGNTCYANAVLQCLMSTALSHALLDPDAVAIFRRYSFNLQILQKGSGSVDSEDEDEYPSQMQMPDSQGRRARSAQHPKDSKQVQDRCMWLTRELKQITLEYSSHIDEQLQDQFSVWFYSQQKPPIVDPGSITRHPNRLSACLRPYEQEDAHEFLRAMLSTLVMNGRNRELSSLFDGLLESSVTCQSCLKPSLTRDRYMDLSLDISADHINTLNDALQEFTQTELLNGDNNVHCSRCSMKCPATKGLRLATAPSILVCHLKRFAFHPNGGLVRLGKRIQFPMELDIGDYMSNLNQARPQPYELVAVLVHLGKSCERGHYVAYCKSNGEWYYCDDTEITKVPFEQVVRQQAYILMYEVAYMRENHGYSSPSGSPELEAPLSPVSTRSVPRGIEGFLSLFCGMDDGVINELCGIRPPRHASPQHRITVQDHFAKKMKKANRRRSRQDEYASRSSRAMDSDQISLSSFSTVTTTTTTESRAFRKSTSSVDLSSLARRNQASKSAPRPSREPSPIRTSLPRPLASRPPRARTPSARVADALDQHRPPRPAGARRSASSATQ